MALPPAGKLFFRRELRRDCKGLTDMQSYESHSRAGADEPDVGIPNILKRILRISLPARAVNRGPALFGANHGQLGSNPSKDRIPHAWSRVHQELG